MEQEAFHGGRGIPRKPHLAVSRRQHRAPRVPPTRGSMGQQQLHTRLLRAPLRDQQGSRPGFTERDSVDPDPTLTGGVAVVAESLLNTAPVLRLLFGPAQ